MSIMPREQVLSKPEMKKALAKIEQAVRDVLPGGDFAERERVTLMLLDEAGRAVFEGDLRDIALGFDDEVLVDGVPYRRLLRGTVTYHSLSGPLVVARGIDLDEAIERMTGPRLRLSRRVLGAIGLALAGLVVGVIWLLVSRH